MVIIHRSIHIVNYETQQTTSRETPETFDAYVSELIHHISSNRHVRDYKTVSIQTEVISCILSLYAHQGDDEIMSEIADTIANRLLRKEIEAQAQIIHTDTEVQKGSLIQALIYDEDSECYQYLLAKVEHTGWVDDADFTFKTGFSKDEKSMWKSCLFDLSDIDGVEFHARVYSNTKAQYWSSGFLELQEVTNDEINTIKAFRAIEATLGHGFKGTSSPDHTIIRNDFIGYLRSHDHIDYQDMVNEILANYHPVDIDLSPEEAQRASERIRNIRTKLLEQPEQKHFDCQFNAISSAINARIRRVYPISEGVDLKVTRDIQDLSETIMAIEEEGRQYLKVRTTNNATFNLFRFNNQ